MGKDGVWAGRLSVVGAVVGIFALLAYPGYVNPVAAVVFYAVVGFAIGTALDWVIRQFRKGSG